MSSSFDQRIAVAALVGLLIAGAPARAALDDALGFERTPPRLAYVDGEVSFYRPGSEAWEPASINTPLATGDELYAADAANLEIQIGARAFLRAGEDTQLALDALEPDFLRIAVPEGHVGLDLRSLAASQTFEIETPNSVFSIEQRGYYRVEVADDATRFITRRGGRARVTPAIGAATDLDSGELVVIRGSGARGLETHQAPRLDAWDRWNYARTEARIDAASARYVDNDVYGLDDLDLHGSWRVVSRYGAVWVPRGVAAGWAPYTTGRWIHDPYYGWSWVDAAPWGWAPYHYGRWVRVSGYWGWAPGPVVARPRYAPALVAFFGGGGVSVGVSIGAPGVGWVALGWGEPIVPWWGSSGLRGVPRWAGWGGPRVVNQVVVKRKTVIHVSDIHRYEHAHAPNAFMAVDRTHFGRRPLVASRVGSARVAKYAPLRGDLELRPGRERQERSFAAGPGPRVQLLSRRDAPKAQVETKRRKGRADKQRGKDERTTPQEARSRRSELARDASGHEQRSTRSPDARERKAPAAPQTRGRRPAPKPTQLARAELPAPQARWPKRPADDARQTTRRESEKSARVGSGRRASEQSHAAERTREPARRVVRKQAGRRQPKLEQAPEAERRAEAQPRLGRRGERAGRR